MATATEANNIAAIARAISNSTMVKPVLPPAAFHNPSRRGLATGPPELSQAPRFLRLRLAAEFRGLT